MIGTLPKYVTVAGSLLISIDAGHPTVPHGTYKAIGMPDGHVRLVNARTHGLTEAMFTVHRDVWPVAMADHRIMEA